MVELPAVIGAADTAVLDPTEEEVCAAMGTGGLNDADAAPGVPECDEVLAEKPDAFRRTVGRR